MMLCYKDKTYCTDTDECGNYDCHRRLDDGVKAAAEELRLPVVQFSYQLICTMFKPMVTK